MNIIKGILLALCGAILGAGLWLVVIFIIGGGTGGAIGGVFASVIGMLIAGAYKKGSGRAGFIGFLVVVIFVVASVFTAITIGTATILYRGGMGNNFVESLDVLLELLDVDSNLQAAFAQDFIISVGIALVLGLITLFGGNKKKGKEDEAIEENAEQ